MGELADADLEGNFVAFLVSILSRGLRGLSDVYARERLAQFAFYSERGAVTRDPETGTYRVDVASMRDAVAALAATLLQIQGDGDYAGAAGFLQTAQQAYETLRPDLDRLASADIPRGTLYRQGMDVLTGAAEERQSGSHASARE
jgi:hypothetical protein